MDQYTLPLPVTTPIKTGIQCFIVWRCNPALHSTIVQPWCMPELDIVGDLVGVGDVFYVLRFKHQTPGKLVGIQKLTKNFIVFNWKPGESIDKHILLSLAIPIEFV